MNLFQKIKKAFKVETKPSSFLSQLLSNSSAPARRVRMKPSSPIKICPGSGGNASLQINCLVTWELYALKKQGKAVKVAKMLHAPMTRQNIYQSLKKEMELVEIDEHPLLDLVNECNREMTGSYIRQLTQIYLDSVGEAFWIKEETVWSPVEIWPIHPTWVTDLPPRTTPILSFRLSTIGSPSHRSEIIWFKDRSENLTQGVRLGMAGG